MSEPIRGLFLVGAYRDNEVDDIHLLPKAIARLTRSSVPLASIRLEALDVKSVGYLLADTIKRDGVAVDELASIVFRKTGGNPFFVRQFLFGLESDGIVFWSAETDGGGWVWDINRVREIAPTENSRSF